MTASEDPASQLGDEAAGPEQPRDDLEHWLSDLRTEGTADPAGWADEDDPAPPPERSEAGASEPTGGGRHRAAD